MSQPSPQLKAHFTRHASPPLGAVAAVDVILKIASVLPALPRGVGQWRGAA
jgi:hypothetical protein